MNRLGVTTSLSSVGSTPGQSFVFVSHSSDLGGSERSMLALASGLRDAGYRVVLVVPSSGALVTLAERQELHVRPTWYRRWAAYSPGRLRRFGRLLQLPLGAMNLAWRLRSERDAVIVTNTTAVGAGALAARLLRRPHIWWVREFPTADNSIFPALGSKRTARAIVRFSDGVVANSRSVAEWLDAHGCRQARVIENPVAYDGPIGPRPTADPSLVLGMLGSLSPHKGHDDAVRAIGLATANGRQVRLIIAGDGSPSDVERIRSLAEECGVGGVVELIGTVRAAHELISRVDLGLVCSWREAFGRVTVEFQKGGRAVLGTSTGETAHLVEDGVTGFLYPRGDSTALSTLITKCHDDRSLVRALGRAARTRFADRYTVERSIEQFLEFVDETLETRS